VSVEAVVFDLDGVLIDSEQLWDEARQTLAADHGIDWPEDASRAMMGMSSKEWPKYMADEVGIPLSPDDVNEDVVKRMLRSYEDHLPLLPGAREAVVRLSNRWPLGLASSSNREIIDVVLAEMGVTDLFEATVSSEEVDRGKPNPDVYLEAARRLGVDASACVAIEDSHNGILSAKAAGMRAIAIPNPHYPPGDDALAEADARVEDLDALTTDAIDAA
jgi:HAD superfamily hydrolase (TIGR01509 family)